MAVAGKVCTGFSKPYVAKYAAGDGTPTYSSGQDLARGVGVQIEPETGESNVFHADNVEAETSPGTFSGGTLTLTVDGLLAAARSLIMGLPEPSQITVAPETQVNVYKYGDNMQIPYMGVGFIVRYMSGGVITYAPYVLRKVQFQTEGLEANTQEDEIDWQTQELTASIFRDDSANHEWQWIGEDQNTEAEAYAVLTTILGGAEE